MNNIKNMNTCDWTHDVLNKVLDFQLQTLEILGNEEMNDAEKIRALTHMYDEYQCMFEDELKRGKEINEKCNEWHTYNKDT